MRSDIKSNIIEIGNILWGDKIKRKRITSVAFFLLADYIFSLNFRRLEWKCNDQNKASKKAALRFGFQYEGLFRQHMIVKGQNRNTAWFSILDQEWKNIKENYINWFKPQNFDKNGHHKQRLQAKNQ